MKIQKFRWSKVYESTEEELNDFLQTRNISAERWAGEAFQASEQQTSTSDTTLWCAEGSLTFRAGTTLLSIQPGDAVHIPANVMYETSAGISGCVCYDSVDKNPARS